MAWDKEKQREYNRQYYLANREAIRESQRVYHESHKEEKKIYEKKYAESKREQIRQYKRIYRKTHPEKIAAFQRTYALKHGDSIRAYQAEYRRVNADKRKALQKAYMANCGLAVRQEWRRKNRAVYLASVTRHCNKRRARLYAARIGTDRKAYLQFVADIRTRPRVKCYWCGKPTKIGQRHIDHIIPLAKGGPDDVHNLCCSCPHCNSSKSDRLPEDFNGQGLLKLG